MRSDLEYRDHLIRSQPVLAARTVPVAAAHGLVLAGDVRSVHPIPLFDNSAMDGYAVHAADVAGASEAAPVTLPVVGDIPAGATAPTTVPRGSAARIMTGGPMPAGADAVVQVELTDAGTDRVQVHGASEPGRFVRRAGGDLAAGDVVARAGTRLTARALASIVSAGHGQVLAHPLPRVAVIATGSELRGPGEACGFGQIPNSNSTLVAACLAPVATTVDLGFVPDEASALRELLDAVSTRDETGEPRFDAVVLSGGVSVGAYDVVKEVLAPEPDMWFGPVAMQPGKPQGSGTYRGVSVFALPGNPVSVYVSTQMLVRPALRALAGAGAELPHFADVPAGADWATPPGRAQYLPARIEHGTAVPATAGGSGSHLVGTLARATGLVRVPAEVEAVRAGDVVQYWQDGDQL
ncbi:molybdopterin molybdenumtransferase MoeA [Pseudactinotalea sp. HY160]|uniref:molybdopterin molybdotransferase MoeA n=1 Tax=Pseudactinotalea sp. HY160 TaxID=2654490 RepID=UPI00128BB35C|nr:gephyrin-like molybdotransferase Glp [Pseudactinotalea sp. HY160]MPV48534.1 molybdopterin molybdenumtransferase MoeA [Pseudactinotalea sp. HY160]